MSELTMAAETETGMPAREFGCLGSADHQRCDADPVVVVLEDGQFNGAAACAEHIEDVKRYETRNNRVWREES